MQPPAMPTPRLVRLGRWLWQPQVGYGLAAAAVVILVLGIGEHSHRPAEQADHQLVALSAIDLSRSSFSTAEQVFVVPGMEIVDLLVARQLPTAVVTDYRVVAELRALPGDDVVLRNENHRAFRPAGDGSIYLEWQVPVSLLESGREYLVEFAIFDRDGNALELDEGFPATRFVVVKLGS